jgi:stage III sporulation protein AC
MGAEISTVLQIFGIGLLVAMLHTILKQSGKEEFAQWATLVGFVVVFAIVIGKVEHLYQTLTEVFLHQ